MKAKIYNDSLFKGRQITVLPKRKNIPGQGASAFRGNNQIAQFAAMMQMMMRPGRGRGGFRGGFRGGARGGHGAPNAGAPPSGGAAPANQPGKQ